jgi:hypothetical protein
LPAGRCRKNAGVHLNLMRTKDVDLPEIAQPQGYRSARIWHCRYRTLAPLASLVNLRTLEIASYPDATLDPLCGLTQLEELRIVHLPQVGDLSPLAALRRLRCLELATLPSWDASGKVTEVCSLAPLTALPVLEEINLFGVRPADRRVDDLLHCQALRRAAISKYPRAEIARLQHALEARAYERGLS